MTPGFDERVWRLAHGCTLELGPSPRIMGILNVTPDSFSDGGNYVARDVALSRASEMVGQGADIVDVGGESTRPGADPVSAEEECNRVNPIVKELAISTNIPISVDTYRSTSAARAVQAGAHIVNDVWGCQKDPALAEVAAATGSGLVIMNTRRDRDVADDLIEDAKAFLERSLEIASKAGVKEDAIVLDPGFGFAPSTGHDIPILHRLEELHSLGFPIMVGTSRKRFLGELTGRDAKDRGAATAATSVIARLKGAALFRVHDIADNKDALAVADAVNAEQFGWK